MRKFYISDKEANQRLDKFLVRILGEAPKSFHYKMLRKKNIVLNGKKADGKEKLQKGDCVRIYLSEETFAKFASRTKAFPSEHSKERPFPKQKLDVLYEDENVILLNKPVGMLSQKASKDDISLVEYLIAYLLETGAASEEEIALYPPGICNRLDRNTSGLVAAGKNLAGLQTLNQWFRDRSIGKYYRCLVNGHIKEKRHISGYLLKNSTKNQVQIYKNPQENSVAIETEYEPVAYGRDTTLLEVHLLTGKTHQIRAHLSYMGHPILGDPKYGDQEMNRKYKLRSQLLHAYRLEFPRTEGPLAKLSEKKFVAPLPESFLKICRQQEVEL